MRLIDAEKLPLEPKEANQFIPYEYASGWNDMLLNVLKAEQIDAVPVVRCRECKHRETVDCPMCHEEYYFDEDDGGDYSLWTRMVDPNGFCSCGERKEGADNG